MSTTGSTNDGTHQPPKPTSDQAYETMSPADQVAADLADRLEIEKRYRAGIALSLERGEEFYNRTQHLVDIALEQEKRCQVERRAVLTDDVLSLSMRDRLSGTDLPTLHVRCDFPVTSASVHPLIRGLGFSRAEWRAANTFRQTTDVVQPTPDLSARGSTTRCGVGSHMIQQSR
jgi:transcriptional antiterminator Rof (Rho-off)